jgi:hypothetical protein
MVADLSKLVLSHPDSVLEVISQIWGKEGVFGVWKGTNSTFVYGVLLRTIETWLRSCFSALLDLSDPACSSRATQQWLEENTELKRVQIWRVGTVLDPGDLRPRLAIVLDL